MKVFLVVAAMAAVAAGAAYDGDADHVGFADEFDDNVARKSKGDCPQTECDFWAKHGIDVYRLTKVDWCDPTSCARRKAYSADHSNYYYDDEDWHQERKGAMDDYNYAGYAAQMDDPHHERRARGRGSSSSSSMSSSSSYSYGGRRATDDSNHGHHYGVYSDQVNEPHSERRAAADHYYDHHMHW